MMIPGFHRVNKTEPCRKCGKPDWCLNSDDGERCICSRVSSEHRWKNAGWFHWVDGVVTEPQKHYVAKQIKRKIDCQAIMQRYRVETPSAMLEEFAANIGVAAASLKCLHCCWASNHNAWAFPMRNERDGIVGIRLRTWDGDKFAVRGSQPGLFVPDGVDFSRVVWICEGPTDAAAMHGIGLPVIGRPSCVGQEEMIVGFVRRHKPKLCIIIRDNDPRDSVAADYTARGAEALAKMLWVPTKIVAPPRHKDARQWINAGGALLDFERIAANTRVRAR